MSNSVESDIARIAKREVLRSEKGEEYIAFGRGRKTETDDDAYRRFIAALLKTRSSSPRDIMIVWNQ